MTNTYAINVTRGEEFAVEQELQDMGLHPWVPRRLSSRYIKERREVKWYDTTYVGKLIFCVIPAIYYRDVKELKHVVGDPVHLSRLDIEGIPAHVKLSTGKAVPAIPGLKSFKAAVEAEYADMQRRKDNSEYQCQYTPGQALKILSGPFVDFTATFRDTIRRAHDDYDKLRLDVSVFGRETPVEIDPDKVRAV